MKFQRHLSVAFPLTCLILLVACADPPASPGTGSGGTETPEPSRRLDVYEALVRQLADPEGVQPIYVDPDLCSSLIVHEPTCSDRLRREEQQELEVRLQDLGEIVFRRDGDPILEEPFQEILLGPIVERPDGLRVEGGSVCGGLCGSGSVYIVVATEDGYEIAGKDESYGSWIA